MIGIKYAGRIIAEVSASAVSLNLSYCKIRKIDQIEGLDKLVNLHKLFLSNNKISQIEGLDKLVNLNKFDLCGNQISKIEGLDKLVNLNTLYLNFNKISKIEGLDKLVNLQYLYLNNNPINQIEGLDKLVNINKNQILQLDFCKEGVESFWKRFQLPENFSGQYLEKHQDFQDMLKNKDFLFVAVKLLQKAA